MARTQDQGRDDDGGAQPDEPGPALVGGTRPRPSLKGVERMSARSRAYSELKYRILEGTLPPNTTLLETEVAQLLGMSRTPVREALIKLEEEDLVIVRPRHGVTVKAPTVAELAEIYHVFSCLEVKAAELVAQRGLGDEARARLGSLMDRMERATRRDDVERWSHLDDEFHSLIVEECGNRRLQATLRQYWDLQYRARMAIVKLRPKPTVSDREHRAIVAAIDEGDVRRAEHLHRNHRSRADRHLLALLRGEAPDARIGGQEASGGTA